MVLLQVFKWATWGKALENLDADKSMSPKDAAKHFKHFTGATHMLFGALSTCFGVLSDEFEEACEQLGNVIIFDEITRRRIVQVLFASW